MTEQERQKLKVKTACCKDCGGWITQSCFPRCESDKDSIKNFKDHLKAGDIIDVVTVGEAMLLTHCKCYLLREAEITLPKPPSQPNGPLRKSSSRSLFSPCEPHPTP